MVDNECINIVHTQFSEWKSECTHERDSGKKTFCSEYIHISHAHIIKQWIGQVCSVLLLLLLLLFSHSQYSTSSSSVSLVIFSSFSLRINCFCTLQVGNININSLQFFFFFPNRLLHSHGAFCVSFFRKLANVKRLFADFEMNGVAHRCYWRWRQ